MENTKEMLVEGIITEIRNQRRAEYRAKLEADLEVELKLDILYNYILAYDGVGKDKIESLLAARKADIEYSLIKDREKSYIDYDKEKIIRGKISHMIETGEIKRYTFEEIVSLLKP